MDKKELLILGIIIVIIAVIAGIILAPQSNGQTTNLEILNKKAVMENGSVYVKLKDDSSGALSDKNLTVQLKDSKGKVVYKSVEKTHATGVAVVKLKNVSAGEYEINITFEGDGNYTGSSISQKIKVGGDTPETELENSTLINETLAEDAQDNNNNADSNTDSQSNYQQPSTNYYPSSSSQSSSSSSSSSSSELPEYDVDGKSTLPEYDEDGNRV